MDEQDGEQKTTYKYHRRSTRLRGHDYTWTRAYFVTTRAQTHDPIFEIPALHKILEETWYAHIPQFRERKNRIANTRDQAGEGPADEEFAAPEPECASVTRCGRARDQCPQNIGKSSAS